MQGLDIRFERKLNEKFEFCNDIIKCVRFNHCNKFRRKYFCEKICYFSDALVCPIYCKSTNRKDNNEMVFYHIYDSYAKNKINST